jgi:hypothetical protein
MKKIIFITLFGLFSCNISLDAMHQLPQQSNWWQLAKPAACMLGTIGGLILTAFGLKNCIKAEVQREALAKKINRIQSIKLAPLYDTGVSHKTFINYHINKSKSMSDEDKAYLQSKLDDYINPANKKVVQKLEQLSANNQSYINTPTDNASLQNAQDYAVKISQIERRKMRKFGKAQSTFARNRDLAMIGGALALGSYMILKK